MLFLILIGDWMILFSKIIFDKSNTGDILKLSVENMRQIIKTEAKIDKFLAKQAQKREAESLA